jgi:hypothetical protein
VIVLGRFQREVIAEPFGLLVRVGMAADIDEQGRVIHGRPLLRVEPDPLGQPQGDQALAQDVLHRLPETEVDPERQRRHQLRQSDVVRVISRASARARCHLGGRYYRRFGDSTRPPEIDVEHDAGVLGNVGRTPPVAGSAPRTFGPGTRWHTDRCQVGQAMLEPAR